MRTALEEEGISILLNARVNRLMPCSDGLQIDVEADGMAQTIPVEAVLISAGRRASLDGLNLEVARVMYDRRGIMVNDRCRTSARHIYAYGDITGRFQFTHMSEHMAKVAVTNALLKISLSIDKRHVPWCTFTDPELAHVGATEAELQEKAFAMKSIGFRSARSTAR